MTSDRTASPDPDRPDDGRPEPGTDQQEEQEVEPAFAVDLDPEDQGTAGAAAESSG